MHIEDADIERAAREVDQAILNSLPEPEDCKHIFSEDFEKKMDELIKK